jgi:amidase
VAEASATLADQDVAFAGAARQAEMVRSGEVSSTELVRLALERIDRIDPELNAFRKVFAERALLEAEQAEARRRGGDERPLLGVPIAIKDEIDVAGEVNTDSRSRRRRTARSCGGCARRARSSSA